jgi:hypothetical protein
MEPGLVEQLYDLSRLFSLLFDDTIKAAIKELYTKG